MTPLCTHGCADPRMCPTCRRTPTPAAPEPLIRAVILDTLGGALAPYLADPRQRHGLSDHLTRRLLDALAADGLHITRRPTREDTDR